MARKRVLLTYPEERGWGGWQFEVHALTRRTDATPQPVRLGYRSLNGALVTRENYASSFRHRGIEVEMGEAPKAD